MDKATYYVLPKEDVYAVIHMAATLPATMKGYLVINVKQTANYYWKGVRFCRKKREIKYYANFSKDSESCYSEHDDHTSVS